MRGIGPEGLNDPTRLSWKKMPSDTWNSNSVELFAWEVLSQPEVSEASLGSGVHSPTGGTEDNHFISQESHTWLAAQPPWAPHPRKCPIRQRQARLVCSWRVGLQGAPSSQAFWLPEGSSRRCLPTWPELKKTNNKTTTLTLGRGAGLRARIHRQYPTETHKL